MKEKDKKKILEDLVEMLNRKDVDILEIGFKNELAPVPHEAGFMEYFKSGYREITIKIYSKSQRKTVHPEPPTKPPMVQPPLPLMQDH